jgi:hypothetical protein
MDAAAVVHLDRLDRFKQRWLSETAIIPLNDSKRRFRVCESMCESVCQFGSKNVPKAVKSGKRWQKK